MKRVTLILITLIFGLSGLHRFWVGDKVVGFIFLACLILGGVGTNFNIGISVYPLYFLFILYFVDLFSTLFRGKLINIPFLGGVKSTNVSEDLKSSSKSISKNQLSEEDELELQNNQKYEDKVATSQRNLEKSTEKFSKGSDPSEFVIKILDGIINNNKDMFMDGDFNIRPGYAYDKFYMDRVDGSYDMSLQGLIHHIMYEHAVYESILSKKGLNDCGDIVKTNPESIYGPDSDDDDFDEVQEMLDNIYYQCIKHVGMRFKKEGIKSNSFSDYLD